ncbi:hypothetical protein GCM10022280_23770 [Sphingomonas swuensis]|uniref:RNase H type-1 domain-containing protein n=1 Tax=Sphingomonas swuensis TaxID=977800 RepID=A0ABP7T850_9SPHN
MTGGPKPLKVYFDGGCRPNPGPIEVAVVARGEIHFFDNLGQASSSDAEWLALCCALEVAQALGASSFDLLGDSRSIIDQAGDQVRTAPSCVDHRRRFDSGVAAGPPRRLRWIPRNQNLAGIALERRRAGRR